MKPENPVIFNSSLEFMDVAGCRVWDVINR